MENIVSELMLKETVEKKLTDAQVIQLRKILEKGLPIVSQPYVLIAKMLSNDIHVVTEQQVIEQIEHWQHNGLIRRFGIVVKHRNLGFTANAMVVWNIDDNDVDEVAKQLSSCEEVSLCYRRPRRLPHWQYNLFCMIHGKSRDVVLEQISSITDKLSLQHISKDILFSTRAFKQHGARYCHQSTNDYKE